MATATKQRLFRTQVNLAEEHRVSLIELLNQHVAESLDLYSQVKTAHWNVKGPQFHSIHILTDEFADEIIEIVDDLAERATALGGFVHGTVRMAAETTSLPEYPSDLTDSMDHVKALVDRIGLFTNSIRSAIDTAANLGDQGTADLYTEVVRKIDLRLWFFEAHLQGNSDG